MRVLAKPRWALAAARAACVVALCFLCVMGPSRANAQNFDFQAPPTATDPTLPAVMRDLAERLLPVYQDPDSDRYLANLSALQLVAGSYSAADVTRQSLRDRHRRADQHRPPGRGVVFDIYAYAKAIESDNRVPFAQGFTRAFREVVPRIGDQDANAITAWLAVSPAVYRDALQRALDQQRGKDSINETDAIQLIWAYLTFAAYREFGPLVEALDAEDDRRRYDSDSGITLKMKDGSTIVVVVIRPKSYAKPLPALLEFTLDASRNYAKECAAHGYIGVTAYSRGKRDSHLRVPYQYDGENARTVIEWLAKQPWSDGRVAMYGTGYSGFTAWAAAKRLPAALKAIATSAPTAPGVDFPMDGSVSLNSAFRWSFSRTNRDSALQSSLEDDAPWRALDQKWYQSGRRYRDMGRLYGKPNPIFIRWLNHPSYDRYWQKMIPFGKQFANVNIPVLTTLGYYTASQAGGLYYFTQHLRYNPHADHTLLIGPYDEGALQHAPPVVQGYPLDPAAVIDPRELRYAWFNFIFKGGAKPALLQDRIDYEVMGANEWRHAASFDALDKEPLKFYLDANPSGEARRLTRNKPAKSHFVRQVVSLTDRSDALWTPSGDIVSKAPTIRNALMYVSEPLTTPADFAGLFSAHLDFAVNKMDLDVEVALYERSAGGSYTRLFGPDVEFRASYTKDRVHRHLLGAGERQEVTFTGERMIGRHFQVGSRLVVVLGVSKRPDREINYGTGNDVSEESLADGKVPIKIRWYTDSYIEMPVRR